MDGNLTEIQTHNNKNQLQATDSSDDADDATYTYNANGHTKTKTKAGITTEYIYNHEERLIAVKQNNNLIAEYVYDPQGRRVKKTVSGVSTFYLYNENGLAAEYSDQGIFQKEYHFHPQATWMTAPQFMRTASNQVYYYHNDHLGTPQELIDREGNIVWQAEYAAFGKATVKINSVENNLRFPGQYFDSETGLHHNLMRDYDVETGRYLQKDFIGLWGGTNNYIYVYADPMNSFDPLGLWRWGDPLPQGLVDGFAGFGDTLSFGLTDKIRDGMGINSVVDKCSTAYGVGEGAGVALSLAFGGAHLGRGVMNQITPRRGLKVALNRIFSDKRSWNTVQKTWSRNVGGYKGKYELHHLQ